MWKSVLQQSSSYEIFVRPFKSLSNAILVGGWTNPFEKYARQVGSSPQGGVKKKRNHDLQGGPLQWLYNWVTGATTLVIGVITQVISGRGPTL